MLKNREQLTELYSRRDVEGTAYEKSEDILSRLNKILPAPSIEADITKGAIALSPAIWRGAGIEGAHLVEDVVLSVEDDLGSIYSTLGVSATVQESGGNIGLDFSGIREAGSAVAGIAGVARGPMSFLELYSSSTGVVSNGKGKTLGLLNASHPDIDKFLDSEVPENLELFVSLNGETTASILRGGDYYSSIDPKSGEIRGHLHTDKLLDKLVNRVMEGKPIGIFCEPATNRQNIHVEDIHAISPGNHIPLLSNESCPTITINLMDAREASGTLTFTYLKYVTGACCDLLNSVIDKSEYGSEEIGKATKRYRKIGIGIMGFADFLYAKKVVYGSSASHILLRDILAAIFRGAQDSSRIQLKRRKLCDVTSPEFQPMLPSRVDDAEDLHWGAPPPYTERYNYNLLSINENEETALLGGTSAGIAPNKSLLRVEKIGEGYRTRVNPYFLEYAERETGLTEREIIASLKKYGSLQRIPWASQKMKSIFVVEEDLPPHDKFGLLMTARPYVDGGLVTNITVPADYSKEQIKEFFVTAIDNDLKTICIKKATPVTESKKDNQASSPLIV